MLEAIVDLSQFKEFSRQLLPRHKKAASSALKSVSYKVNQKLKPFARSKGGKVAAGYAPITIALRKGAGYGSWFAKFSQYAVDTETLQAKIGMIGPEDVVGINRGGLQPVSKGFTVTAKRLARGYTFRQTRRRQRHQVKALMQSEKKYAQRIIRKQFKTAGAASWHRLIPRVGVHRVQARPIVEPFMSTIKRSAIDNLRRLYVIKLKGERYGSDWTL
jgi:hypothetical protein